MNNKNNYCIIMAGGVGSRFWPASTKENPKQFLDILGTGETLIQATFRRFSKFILPENIYISTNAIYTEVVKKQLPLLAEGNIIPEPAKRNTAPCILYAAAKIKKKNANANMIVSPSDHLISDEVAFVSQLELALDETAQNNVLLTLGIKPHAPKTGFGYIQFSEEGSQTHPEVRKVKTFTEKPDIETAKIFIESGEFLWNAGIFIWNANTILNAFDKYLPDMYAAIDQGWDYLNTDEELNFINSVYSSLENESIDYGILEKSNAVFVLPSEFGWSDLGTWGALTEHLKSDNEDNIVVNKNVLSVNTTGNIISIPKKKIAAIAGLENYIVVDTPKGLLICPKDDEQTIKNFVSEVKVMFGEKYV